MKKIHSFSGIAAMAIAITVVACASDDDLYVPSDAETQAYASEQLGVTIDPNQDWNMTGQAQAAITVNGDYGENYTVKVYSNNPLVDRVGYVLAKGTIDNGGTFSKSFEYPSVEKRLVVGITNSHGFTNYRAVPIVNGQLEAVFGKGQTAQTRSPRKSKESPSVPNITVTNEYAESFLEGASEPNDANIFDDYDNSHYEGGSITITTQPVLPGFNLGAKSNNAKYSGGSMCSEDELRFYNDTWAPLYEAYDTYQLVYYPDDQKVNSHNAKIDLFYNLYNAVLNSGYEMSDWLDVYTMPTKGEYSATGGNWVVDETYVTKFKITGTWDKNINVLPYNGRSVYVSGTWNIPGGQDQYNINTVQVNAGSVIVVADGGTIYLPQNSKLILANQARLVVMPGGWITGEGTIEVTNGNEEGYENYNGGVIEVGEFNNNYGKFYNNGSFYATTYGASSTESNFYNHGVAHINNAGDPNWYRSPNARIYNACQWYCENDMRAYVLELEQGSYFRVDGQLMMSESEEATADPSYVSMASGALLQAGDLRNNLTSWVGPEEGYAVCEFGKVTYLNWEPGTPTTGGYFINNIAVSIDDKTPLNHDNFTPTYEHFMYAVANAYGTGEGLNNYGTQSVGTGNTVMVDKGKADMEIPASNGFFLGRAGCTPGYSGTPQQSSTTTEPQEEPVVTPVTPDTPAASDTPQEPEIQDVPAVWSYAYEDTPYGDYDMNDVVIKVSENEYDSNYLNITLCCTGATLNLTVHLGYTDLNGNQHDMDIFGGTEVHRVLGSLPGEMVNTGVGPETDYYTTTILKPEGFSFETADFWIDSPATSGGVHVAKKGQDPHGIAIPADWEWPREFTSIKDAYPNFVEFAKDASTTDEAIKGWYKKVGDSNPVPEKVYSK